MVLIDGDGTIVSALPGTFDERMLTLLFTAVPGRVH